MKPQSPCKISHLSLLLYTIYSFSFLYISCVTLTAANHNTYVSQMGFIMLKMFYSFQYFVVEVVSSRSGHTLMVAIGDSVEYLLPTKHKKSVFFVSLSFISFNIVNTTKTYKEEEEMNVRYEEN